MTERAELETLIRHKLSMSLPAEYVPSVITIVDALPTLPSGKLDRKAVEEWAGSHSVSAGSIGSGADLALLLSLLSIELAGKVVAADDDLRDLGLSSLSMVGIVSQFEELTQRSLSTGGVWRTARDLLRSAEIHTSTTPRVVTREHEFSVPLDYSKEHGEHIPVRAKSIAADTTRLDQGPYLLFLQGGPAGSYPDIARGLPPWMPGLLSQYCVVLLDQRGGGRSSALSEASIDGMSDCEAAVFLRNFRADSIVRDAEYLRAEVLGVPKWSLLGESYGGMIALTYLSFANASLDAVVISSGLSGPGNTLEDFAQEALQEMKERNRRFYLDHEIAEVVSAVYNYVDLNRPEMSDGTRLSSRQLRMLGVNFGFDGGPSLVSRLFSQAERSGFSLESLEALYKSSKFSTEPLFYLQEMIHAEPGRATNWCAESLCSADAEVVENGLLYFFGEVTFDWMFVEQPFLRPFAQAARKLAEEDSWTPLYDAHTLLQNSVPVRAFAAASDPFIPAAIQARTARVIGNCELTLSSNIEHAGPMTDGVLVLNTLADLSKTVKT